jgi:hypothetical protein
VQPSGLAHRSVGRLETPERVFVGGGLRPDRAEHTIGLLAQRCEQTIARRHAQQHPGQGGGGGVVPGADQRHHLVSDLAIRQRVVTDERIEDVEPFG